MTLDASIQFAANAYPVPGYFKSARFGGLLLPIESGSISIENSYQYHHYALTRVSGAMQKVLHSRGTKQISWSLSGSLFVESADILALFLPSARNQVFPLEVQQESPSKQLSRCLVSSVSLSGSARNAVSLSLQGVALDMPTPGGGYTFSNYKYPVPGWFTGNSWIKSWSISHTINYSPNWANDQNPLPAYYRVGESEYDFRITTSTVYQKHDSISLGVGNILMLSGVIENEVVNWAGTSEESYDYTVKNVSVTSSPYSDAISLNITGATAIDWI